MEGVDYAFTTVDEQALYAAGKRFAMRYVGPGSAGKHLNAAERDRLWAAGLSIVLLAEGAVDDPQRGYSVGVEHASVARSAADALGAPRNLPIYFAVDRDENSSSWPPAREYLRGADSILGEGLVGVYGEYDVMAWAARDTVAAWYFQTYAWSGQRWYAGNHVEQYHNGVTLAGGDVDLCRAKTDYFGQWRPGMELTDKVQPGSTVTVGQALMGAYLAGVRTDYLANHTDLVKRLDAILAAETANPGTTVTMTDADRAALAAQLAAAIHVPSAAEIATAVIDALATAIRPGTPHP